MQGIILYGPPGVGKDTITEALTNLDPHYALFPRIKIGSGRTTGYRMATHQTLKLLRANGEIIWENARYDATYVIDRPELTRRLHTEIPVLHLGQHEGIAAIVNALPTTRWSVVDLHCPRPVGVERIKARGTRDAEQRIAAWDETPRLASSHLSIDTSKISPDEAARLILKLQSLHR